MANKPTVRPGAKVPDSGIYRDDSGKKATMVRGEPAPPTTKPGQKWTQVVDTNPKN
ncbi:MAG: YjzC family protein [Gammaproteobacteria bacterium]|nr:YjzC family protein [Gammaproteobacteria bacterium]